MKKIIPYVTGFLGILLLIIGSILKIIECKPYKPISIINGTDGPTSIFLTEKIGTDLSVVFIIMGILLIIITILFSYFLHKKQK